MTTGRRVGGGRQEDEAVSGAGDGGNGGGGTRRLVWDIALRLFHWSLVALVAFSVWSGKTGGFQLMEKHKLAGYTILALVLFRLAWGVVGGRHARFREFVSSPMAALRYARESLAGRARRYAGHNPLGAWSVLALLASVAVQAVSGLFTTDEILTEGPFHDRAPAAVADWMTSLHYWNSYLLLALIAVHVAAVLLHELKGERLIAAMIHGRKAVPADPAAETAPVAGRWWLATLLAAVAAGAVWTLLRVA